MFIDKENQVSNAQAVTADAGSTDVIDLTATASRPFEGEPLVAVVIPTVAADFTTGDETYTFVVQTDDNSSFSSAATAATRTIAASALTVGSIHTIPVPGEVALERYMRLYYDVGGTTPSITVTAFIVPQSFVSKIRYYDDAVTIAS